MESGFSRLFAWRFIFILIALTPLSVPGQEVIPNYYSEPGVPSQRKLAPGHLVDRVDPFSGKLTLQHVDLVVPGNGGLDIRIVRSYSSQNDTPGERTPWGSGWTMHFGRVLITNPNKLCSGPLWQLSVLDNPVLEMPDGSRQILADSSTLGPGQPLFMTVQRWKADCIAGGLLVTSTDGTQFRMDRAGIAVGGIYAWYPTLITDRNANTLTLNYQTQDNATVGPLLTSITASDGRTVTFTYTDPTGPDVRLNTISANGQIWTYAFTPTPNQLHYWNLSTATRPAGGTSWSYTYNGQLAGDGAGSYSLRTVTHPEGGQLVFDYTHVNFFADGPVTLTAVSKKTAAGIDTWTYTYTPSSAAGVFDTTTVTLPASNGTITYRHHGYNTVASGEVWKVGLLQQKTIGSIQTETYTWTSQVISNEHNQRPGQFTSRLDTEFRAPVLATRTIVRDGTTYSTTYTNPDTFGNPQQISETGNNSNTRVTTATYYVNTSKWIVNQLKNETITVNGASVGTILRDFDANGNMSLENPFGVPATHTFWATGDLHTTTDARNNTRTFLDYFRGIPRSETHPENVTIGRTVDDAGNVRSETDGEQFIKGFSWDGLNRLAGITYPRLGSAALTIVWAGARQQTVTRGDYQEIRNFDDYGRLARLERRDTTLSISVAKTFSYDVLGRRSFESDWGATTGRQYAFDLLDRLTKVTNVTGPTGNSFRLFIYPGNNSLTVRNERSYDTTYRYRSFGDPSHQEVMAIELPEPGTNITITRNGVGKILTVTQGGVPRTFGYDTRFFLTSETHPETGVTTYDPDEVGNIRSKKVGSSPLTTFIWDNLNRLRFITYPDTSPLTSVEQRYDRRSKLTWVSNPAATRQFFYDENGNLNNETLAVGAQTFTVLYGIDSKDHLNTITYPSGQVVTYAPDALGRPRQVSPFVTSVAHHPSGQVSNLSYANGVTTTLTFYPRLWPATLQIAKGSTNYIYSSFNYDQVGNLSNLSDSVDINYNLSLLTYDTIDRLKTVNGSWGAGSFGYNERGDISTTTLGAASLTYTYDGTTRRLNSISGSANRTYGYDVYGNISSDGTTTFSYDHAPNLRAVNQGLPTQVLYDYDGKNMMVQRQRSGIATIYFYAANGDLFLEYQSAGNTFKEYVWLAHKQVAVRTLTNLAQTTVSPVASSLNASQFGQNVTFSVNVTGINPTGSVTFKEGPNPFGTAALAGGRASFGISSLAIGMHGPVTARYEGDANNEFAISARPDLIQIVQKRATTTTLASSRNPAAIGTNITFTATISGSSPGGTVDFRNGASTMGTGPVSAGQATFSTPSLSIGNYSITASYSGDSINDSSTSSQLTQVIRSIGEVILLRKRDTDGDGKADILWRNTSTGENYFYFMDGLTIKPNEGYFRTVTDQAWQIVGRGDFDGDGKADILWRNANTGENYIYPMDGLTIKTSEGSIRTIADQNWQVAGIGDFDGDGKDDILWRNASTGENYIYFMDGLTIRAEGFIRTVADQTWQIAGVGDFDGDGKADIFWRRSSTGETYIYPMDGLTIKPSEGYSRTVVSADWQAKGVGDFDGDGMADVLWRNSTTGENYLWPMNGLAIKPNEGYLRTVADLAWQIAAVGDYDGDGKTDILWRNTTTGENYIYPMDGTTIKATEGYTRTVVDQAWTAVSK